ncbi:scarecrow-like protein 27 [Phoenix dactylifera]|uniref:Scarecrow-like protein 27 n=1 Tax=Phoenix dactylifera TaxID=42345 RepID=A0A8B8J780_PHODC|nr:scarecrow-like protein 27 [Phoenix dactylifera]
MRGMPFSLQEEGALEVLVGGEEKKSLFWGSGGGCGNNKRRKGQPEGSEPRSVLDNRRSPSPPTSTSTLSSSLGGGGASSDTAGVAAVSDNPGTRKWPPAAASGSAAIPSAEEARKEEWAAELQPIPAAAMESGGGKCGGVGLGAVEDWEAMFSESAASPGQEPNFLRWIMSDIDDAAGLKHHLIPPPELDCGSSSAGTFGLVDPGFGLDPIGGLGGGAVASISSSNPSPFASSATSAGGFGLISCSSGSVKVPTFGVGNTPNTAAVFPPVPANSLPLPLSLPPGVFHQDPVEEKPLLFGPSLLLSQHQQAQAPQNPAFFLPLPHFDAQPPVHLLPPQTKRHHPLSVDQMAPKSPFASSPGPEFFLRRGQPQPQPFPPLNVAPFHLPQRSKVASGGEAAATAAAAAQQQHQQQHQQQQALVEQLLKVAELVEAGNTVSARGILARLNQQLPSPVGKPLLRSAFYFKEALHLLTSPAAPNHPPSPLATPFDVVLKLGTVKAFSDVSPVLQFTNFTSVQALLEELEAAPRIHVVDFDIGVGGQWSAFMQELAQRRCTAAGAASPSLKITAFASPCSHHPLELHLTRENLAHFAADLNIPFEFNLLSLDPFDPSLLLSLSSASADEAIAVNIPVGSAVHPPVPTLLRLVKQLSPKIVISVDHGGDRSDLPFPQHFWHAFQSYTVLLDSIDAAGTNLESANKIERFLVQPRIENAVLGRHRNADKLLPWRTLFPSAGFVPVQFSNFAETQAECLLKRVQVRGFHVEKRQASLSLCWQRMELVSVSAWRC